MKNSNFHINRAYQKRVEKTKEQKERGYSKQDFWFEMDDVKNSYFYSKHDRETINTTDQVKSHIQRHHLKYNQFSNTHLSPEVASMFVGWLNNLGKNKNWSEQDFAILKEDKNRIYILFDNLKLSQDLFNKGMKYGEICNHFANFLTNEKSKDGLKFRVNIMIVFNLDQINELKDNTIVNWVFQI